MADLIRARAAKRQLRELVAGRPGVCGVGITRARDGFELCVDVTRQEASQGLPASVGGVRVRVRVTGSLHAQGPWALWRPAHR